MSDGELSKENLAKLRRVLETGRPEELLAVGYLTPQAMIRLIDLLQRTRDDLDERRRACDLLSTAGEVFKSRCDRAAKMLPEARDFMAEETEGLTPDHDLRVAYEQLRLAVETLEGKHG